MYCMDAAVSTRAPTLPLGDSVDMIGDTSSASASAPKTKSCSVSGTLYSDPTTCSDTKSASDSEFSCTPTKQSADQTELSQLLTIIVVTSPVISNPSCELMENVLASLALLGNSIEHCKRIIVCDGYKLV